MAVAEYWIIGWTLFFGLVGINGFAAGMAAILHIWRGKDRLRIRVLLAATLSGALPSSVVVVVGLAEGEMVADAAVGAGLGLAFLASTAVTGLASLPGALVISRKLAGPGDAFRAFE